ncbi:unnamed protein product [Parnassius mnemosyne]|uniref:Gustatory receptor n=2 Tax=Parnassius mnemosyne TaxID=213953 RepID=A0AAV1L7F0_9NEOP
MSKLLSNEVLFLANPVRNEILLDNFLEADLQKFLLPLNFIQQMMFSPKYCIRYNFITPNSRIANCIYICSTFCVIITYIYIIIIDTAILQFPSNLYVILIFNSCITTFGWITNAINNVIQSDLNIDFILKFQKIQKFTHITYRQFVTGNWIHVLVIILFYIVICSSYAVLGGLNLRWILACFPLLLADLDIIYMIRMIKFLRCNIVIWNMKLKHTYEVSVIHHAPLAAKRVDEGNKMKNALIEVLDASDIYKKICSIPILYYTVLTFGQSLSNVQAVIMFSEITVVIGMFLMWAVKNIVLLVLISFECENFFITLKNTQIVLLMSQVKECSVEERLVYKSLLRACRASSEAMSACGVVSVDAKLPLRLLSVLVTYTIVLLQFAFL